jgi:cobalt-zinc-cadmium efflux system outer membrane protein
VRLSLQTATDLLIKNNLPVIAARYNVDILHAQRIAAGLRPNPTMTFSATQFVIPRVFHLPSDLVETNNENGAANTTYTVEIDQLIERGGKRELRSEQADLNMKAAEAQVQDALRQQLFQLRQAFFTAVLARENLRVAKENLDHFDRTENLLFIQVKEGYSAGVDLKRIQLQQVLFHRDVATAGQGFQQAVRDVLNLIGQGDAPSAANSTQLTTSSPSQTGFPQDLIDGNLEIIPELLWIEDLRRMALASRPDIKAAELNVEAADAGLKLAESQRVRDVVAGGQYSRTGSDNTVGVVVGLPLKIGPRATAAIAQATSSKLQAEAQLRLVRTQALTDVEKAFTAYQVSRDRLRLFTGGALATADDVRRIEEIAYRDGAKGLLDYLDAQRTYNQTLVDYNQTRFDFLMSLYQLEFATGSAIVK